MPHKNPQQTYITDLDMPGVQVEGVPPIIPGDTPGSGMGQPLFELPTDEQPYIRRGRNGIFRDPGSYDNRT